MTSQSAALIELRRVQPDISLDWISRYMPFKHEQERALLSGGFSSRRLALVSKIQRPSLSDQNGYSMEQ